MNASAFLLGVLIVPASAQVRLPAVEAPVTAAPLAAAAPFAGPAAAPTAPALLSAPLAAAPAAASAAPESAALWTGGIPASAVRRQLRAAKWETTKFFFTSRVKMLRDMIEQQKAETAGKLRAVEDLEGSWLDWRTKGYSGRVTVTGFEVADRPTIRRQALAAFDRRFPKDEASRAAFRRYLDRVDKHVSPQRPSNYRKHAFSVLYELPTVPPHEVPARIDAMLSDAELAKTLEHRAARQPAILASFETAALAAIRDVNAELPEGRKVVAVIMIGSYALRQSTPKSDLDYQLVTQDGGFGAIAPFAAALDRRWTENRIEKVEAFQFTLPPSRALAVESFQEGYQVFSPDPAAVAALSKSSFSPEPAGPWARARGAAFGAFYRAWCWTYFRLADLRGALRS